MKKILLTLLCTLLPLIGWAQENEPYAVLSDNNTVLTFYYDGHKAERNGLSVGPFSWPDYQSWYAEREAITTVVFDASFAACTTLTSTKCWFHDCSNLVTISGMENLKTDNVTSVFGMFEGCSNLTSLDLSNFKTENVTDMVQMFSGCSSLTSIDLSSFKTDNVTSMSFMFSGCSSLTSLNVSSFITDNVTSMGRMFSGCSSLTSLDVSGFKTDNVTSMVGMFYSCSSLTSLDVSGFNTDNVTEMGSMFSGCSGLTSLDVSGFKTDNVRDMAVMFWACSGLTSLDVSGFKTDNVTNMSSMFYGCSSLTSLDVSSFNTENVTNMEWMFNGCSSLTSLDVSSFNTSNVTNMWLMFSGCSGLTSIDVSGFNTDNVTNMEQMFRGCSGLTSLDVSGFKTDNVTNMGSMFYGCSGLTTIYVGDGWSTSAVTYSGGMFIGCSNLVGGKGTKYNYSHTDYTYARIDQGPDSDAPGYFTRSGDAPWIEPEAYAVLSDNNTVLTFYYDDHKAERNGMSIGPFHVNGSPLFVKQSWYAEREAITTVVFDVSFAACPTLTSTSYWFTGCYNLATISGLENLNTEKLTSMSYMFSGCSGLTSLDLSGFKTDNVTSMVCMFWDCSALTNLDLSSFNTENVTDMGHMFSGCSGLKSLDLSGFNTENVTDMSYMFSGCSSLTSLDLSSFNTEKVTKMAIMFFGCSSLTSLGLSCFKTDNVTDMSVMFGRCSSLTSLDLSNFNTSNVTNMSSMFGGCEGLTTIYVGEGWNTSAVTSGDGMFTNCPNLVGGKGTKHQDDHTDYTYARIDQGPDSDAPGYFTRSGDAPWVEPETYAVLSDSNTVLTFYYDDQKAERNGMSVGSQSWSAQRDSITTVVFDTSFAGCTTLTSTAYWFSGCKNLTTVSGIENLNTENVTNMSWMFDDCSSLTSLDLSSFNTENVTNMGWMFFGCSSLTSLDLSSFNTENVTNMGWMFFGCSSLTSLDLSSFNTEKVTKMAIMFFGCSSLASLDLSSFNTSNITDMNSMFDGCSGLTSLDLSSFNTADVTSMNSMFYGCSGLRTIYVGEGWNTSAVISGDRMFSDCSNLVGGKGTKYNYSHYDYTYARIDQGPDSDAPGYFTRSGDIPWGEKSTFDGRVLTVRGSGSIDVALAQVGGFEQVDKTITAIVWEADVPYSGEAAFSNPNLLFYANDATKEQAINNLIYNGVAESITLTDEGEGNIDFYCPQSFTARSITYRRSFLQQTEIGVSRGWETIALPFTVQRISRVRSGGEGRDNITPFGSSESTRHFWLRRLTANGLQSVQAIEANTPYIIAMPNSEEYAAEYNLAGDIVFTAENATVAVTEPVSDRSTDYELTANFERMAAQDSIYVLNVGTPRYGYPEGSIFEAAYRDLPPFRAYTRHINSGRPAPPYFALGNLGGNSTTGISSVNDDAFATDTWYDIQGRKLQGRPTKKGVYIQNGRKVIVK